MLQSTHLIGFGAKRAAAGGGTITLISQGSGTAIGDMTSNGNLAASFDSNASQGFASCSRSGGGINYGSVGKNWGTNKTVTQYRVIAPNNLGFSATGAATNTFKLYGHTSTPGAFNNSGSGGTLLHTAAGQSNATGADITFNTSIDTSTAYQAHWVQAQASSGANEQYFCEVEFYETI